MRKVVGIFFLLFSLSGVTEVKDAHSASHTSVLLQSAYESVEPGRSFNIAFTITPKEGWYTYWENPGDSGAKNIFEWTVPEGVTVSAAAYEAPKRIPYTGLMTYGYKRPSTVLFTVDIMSNYTAKSLPISLEAEWLVCEEECIPQYGSFKLNIPVEKAIPNEAAADTIASFSTHQPEISWWDSRLIINDTSSALTIEMSEEEIKDYTEAYFFPKEDGVFTYSAPQTVVGMAEGLVLNAERSNSLNKPEQVTGILFLKTAKGDHQYFYLAPTLETPTIPKLSQMEDPIEMQSFPLWQALLFAFLGGALLNLMPCVFPVLSLKAFAFVSAGSLSKADRHKEGWAYTSGILASFLAIAVVLIALRSGGDALGWGFQLQEPRFVGLMVIILTLVAMSLAGIFNIQTGFEGAGQTLTQKSGAKGAFFTGVLATLVATPCTVPLMAPAIGYALTQDSITLTITLMMLGLGLASPFLLLSYSDTLASKMPRPGPWMEKVKQGLSFPMILTALWLATVYGDQTGQLVHLFAFVTFVAFLIWLREQMSSPLKRILILGVTLAFSAWFLGVSEKAPDRALSDQPSTSNVWTEQAVSNLRAEGKPVFVYFTADWCITCKVNEKVALQRTETEDMFKRNAIVVLKSDETAGFTPDTLKVLKKYGRAGIPLYLYYPKDGSEARLLPSVITIDILKEYIEGKGV
ncbi:protein-disulfide reductase DsbD family protein [Temperatibacter marinus]|uniref:Protein-disulfide reductase DsbD family protein n=1 Tax=Temperatibacter marinus TaxID=1456591 RepID=A0AA52H8U4_9PROT|nr:protein-disulfide reductase DsbD domain-containing protein [Temperatibacter marinus]WND02199.1 protein-disulfide reductase DsbD family protein [Temperatibacter marinus]